MRVIFATNFVDGKNVYEQGKTYTLLRAYARHLLARGIVQVANEQKRVTKRAPKKTQSISETTGDTASTHEKEG